MILLDTDHFNVLQIGKGTSYETLAAHMDASPNQHFATTVVTFEEHMCSNWNHGPEDCKHRLRTRRNSVVIEFQGFQRSAGLAS